MLVKSPRSRIGSQKAFSLWAADNLSPAKARKSQTYSDCLANGYLFLG